MLRKTKSVSDLGTASYILMHEFKIAGKKEKNNSREKEIFFFVDDKEKTEEKFDELMIDYLSSEFHRFDSCLMSLKKIRNDFGMKTERSLTDLGAAAYVLMLKYKIVGKKERNFYFEVYEKDKFDEVVLEYLSSDYHKFDSALMSLKKLGDYLMS